MNGATPTVYASRIALGLETGDDLDAFCLEDNGDGIYVSADDDVLLSLSPGSPTLAQIGAGAGDILSPDPANPSVALNEAQIGLVVADDVDALKCSQMKDPNGDTDGDTIPNSSDPDDDNDGCTDAQENGPNQALGGKRDAHVRWDIYDVWTFPGPIRDESVAGTDIFAIIGRFNTVGNPAGDPDDPAGRAVRIPRSV